MPLIFAASSDSSCFVWDIEHGKPIYRFLEHEGDVLSIDVQVSDQISKLIPQRFS